MHKLTQTQLYRCLDRAIEILRPTVTGPYAVETIMALLILKRANDQMVTGPLQEDADPRRPPNTPVTTAGQMDSD